jgi:hypothetical protein
MRCGDYDISSDDDPQPLVNRGNEGRRVGNTSQPFWIDGTLADNVVTEWVGDAIAIGDALARVSLNVCV